MRPLQQGRVNALCGLEDNESEAPGAAGDGVHLEGYVLDLAVGLKVLLDVAVLSLLGQRAHKQLPIILVYHGHTGSLAVLFCHL